MVDYPKSIRHQMLIKLEELMSTIVVGEPVEQPYELAFSKVTREPVDNLAVGQRSVLGIYAGTEQKNERAFTVKDCTLDLVFEAHVRKDTGEKIADLLEVMAMQIERRLMEDTTLGDLIIDINVTGSDPDIDGQYKNQAMIAVYATAVYEHHRDNPALERGDE